MKEKTCVTYEKTTEDMETRPPPQFCGGKYGKRQASSHDFWAYVYKVNYRIENCSYREANLTVTQLFPKSFGLNKNIRTS